MNKLIFLLLLLSFSPVLAQAQPLQGQARLDSLLAEAKKMEEDTAAVRLMNRISAMYNRINPDEGLKWAQKELALAQKLGWRKGECFAYNDLGNNYQFKGAYPESLEAFFNGLHIAEEQGDKERAGAFSGNIGNVYRRQKEYPKALEWQLKALRTAEEGGDKQRILVTLGNIGNVYQEQGNYKAALDYVKKALRISEEIGDKGSIIINLSNIGGTHAALKQYNAALMYEFKALHMAEDAGDKTSIAVNVGNIGEVYYAIATDSNAPKADGLVPAGKKENLARAIEYLNKGIAACREAQFGEAIPEFAEYLSKARSLQGDYKGALAAYQLSKEVQDSLHNIANSEAIANLETKRAVELKDKDIQIARLKKRNERVLFAGGIVVLLLLMGILFRGFKKQQKSNRLLSKEKKRSEDLLLNILPTEVAEELKDKGQAVARQFDEVTVLFTDFVDFTSAAEALSPHELVKELHECFSAFDAICEKHGLEKIKTIGDAYMAVCGMPVADPCHAQKAVHAALDILAFMESRRLRAQGFEIRIGIHSGPVVAGIVGVKKFAYDIWGDTVNTAARMEQSGEAGKINLSYSTYERIKDDFYCTSRGKIATKHKGEVEMYFVAPFPASAASASF